MEEAAVSHSCTGEFFSIDIAAVVLSRRAVDILTEASCAAAFGLHRSDPSGIREQSACSSTSTLCGQLSLRPHSPTWLSQASSSAPGWPDRVARCNKSRERGIEPNRPSTADTSEVSGDRQARCASPLRVMTSQAISEVLRQGGEAKTSNSYGSEKDAHEESCSTGGVCVAGGAGVEASSNNTLWSSERLASSTTVSSPRRGSVRKRHTDAHDVSADRHENQTRIRHPETNDSAGSLQCHRTARSSSHVVGSTHAAPEKDTYFCFRQEYEGDSWKEPSCHQCRTEHVYNFLGTAFTATRSSLYVCVPIDASEDEASLERTYTCPFSVAPRCERPQEESAGNKSTAATAMHGEDSPARTVVSAKDVTSQQWNEDTADVRPVFNAASPHVEYRNNFVSGGLRERKTPTMIAACAAGANATAPGAAADTTPDSAVSVASSAASFSSGASPALSPAAHRAAADVGAVAGRIVVTERSESLRHDVRQLRSHRKTSPAALRYGNGLRCAYTQCDPLQPVVTPTCDVFRLIHHLYAFFARCAADFTSFAADVYVVPVWRNTGLWDTGAAATGGAVFIPAATAECQPTTGETISAEAVTLADTSTSANAAAATGSAAQREQGGGDGPTPSSSTPTDATLATDSSAARGRTAEAAGELDRETCGWQNRLLEALQSHSRSCRGTRMTGRKLVNVVDSGFELTDRTFALASSVAEDFAAHSCALPVNTRHTFRIQPFSEVFSALRIPPAPPTDSEKKTRQPTAPSRAVEQPTGGFGAESRVQKKDSKEAAPVKGASACDAETAGDTEDALYEEARATADCAVEAPKSGSVATETAVAGAAGIVVVRPTDVEGTYEAGVAESMEAEGRTVVPGEMAGDGTATTEEGRRTGLADQGRPLAATVISQFAHVIVAGTFDRLHAGHKLLLTVAALLSTDILEIGTTAGALTQKKMSGDAAEAAAAVQTFAARAHAAAAFVALVATAARASSSPAAVINQMGGAFSGATPAPVASTARRERGAVITTGHDAAVTAAGEVGEDHLPETTRASEGSGVADEWISIEGEAPTIAKVKQDSPHATRTAATALEVAACGGRTASTTLNAYPADVDGFEATSTRRIASSRPLRFVNYCQTVLREEVFKQDSTQRSDPLRCECANRPDADLNSQRHTCTGPAQREGTDTTPIGKIEEQSEKQNLEEEEREKQWRERICEAVADAETVEAVSRMSQGSDDNHVSSPRYTLTRRNTCDVRYPESSCPSKDTCKPTFSDDEDLRSEGDHVLLAWTSCVLPPHLSLCCRNRAACRRRRPAAADVSSHLRVVREAGNNGSGDSGPAFFSTYNCPDTADTHPSFVTTAASVSASSHSASSSPLSSAASSPSAWLDSLHRHEASLGVPSSSLRSSPEYTTETHIASPTASSLGAQRSTNLTALNRSTASPEGAASRPPASTWPPPSSGTPLSIYIISLEDRLGPAGDLDFDALVVSSESLAGGFYVNEERIKRYHSPVCLVEVPAVPAWSELFSHVETTLMLDEQETVGQETCFSTGKFARHASARGSSSVRLEGTRLSSLKSHSVLPAQILGACECRGVKSRIDTSHTATHNMHASADQAYMQPLTTGSLAQETLVEEDDTSAFSRDVRNSRTIETTGQSKSDAVTPANVAQGVSDLDRGENLCTKREKRLTEEFCECDINSKDRRQEQEASASVASPTSAGVGSKSKQVNTDSSTTAPDVADKLSSSQLRHQQANILQNLVDIAFLRRRFADAAGELFRAPAPVWNVYWSMLCSQYVAPWRRLFTVERLARLLSRIDTVKERVPGLKCFDKSSDAILTLSLCFAYALHPPPGLCHCSSPRTCAAVAASSTLMPGSRCPDEIPTCCSGSCASGAALSSQTHTWKPSHECGRMKVHVTGAGRLLGSGGAYAPAREHSVEEGGLVMNEQIMRGFMWDAAVCNQLRLYCLNADFAKQPPLSDTASERNCSICDHAAAVLQEASQVNVDRSRRDQGDPGSAVVLPPNAGVNVLHILVSCMRTARESCGFLLPRHASSVSAPARNCFQDTEEGRTLHGEDILLQPYRSNCTRKSCLQKHIGDLLHSKAEPFNRTLATRLQQLESKCCRAVHIMELLELALPVVIYDLCARRMREEYYHMSDRHYACHRKRQLQGLQVQLCGGAHGLTEVEIGLVRQNIARELLALDVNDRMQRVEGTPTFARACDR